MERRHFLLGSAAFAAGARAFAAPNDTVRIGLTGIGGRGRNHIDAFGALENVEIAAICDIDQSHAEEGAARITGKGWPKPDTYEDVREMLDDDSIDAIAISAPNHWHTLMTVWACQAGKDVYVEKPGSHNMFESQQIVAAARKYDRIVQHGSQIRTSVAVREAIQHLRDGLIGDVYLSRGLCFKWRNTIGHTPVEPVPPGVNYDLWTGPAPLRPFTRNRFHYNWHWFWDTGNGDLGNQGIHQVDLARWGLGVKYPTKVSAVGGKFMFNDDQETPNTLNCAFEFNENGMPQMMEFEVRHWISNGEAEIHEASGNSIGATYYGSDGYLAIPSYSAYKTWLGREQEPGPSGDEGGDHFANFIDAVRSRDRASLNSEIAEGALSCNLVHLANISYRLGRTLHFDADTMTCIGDPEANAMFTRNYREPYVVPEEV